MEHVFHCDISRKGACHIHGLSKNAQLKAISICNSYDLIDMASHARPLCRTLSGTREAKWYCQATGFLINILLHVKLSSKLESGWDLAEWLELLKKTKRLSSLNIWTSIVMKYLNKKQLGVKDGDEGSWPELFSMSPEMEFLNGTFSQGFWRVFSDSNFCLVFYPHFYILQNAIDE